jgi:hypothetical protein
MDTGQLGFPDLHWVVLDPAGLGIELAKGLLRHRNNLPKLIENEAS